MNTKIEYSAKHLLIDGNFFGHRLIHGIRINQPEFNLNTQKEIDIFNSSLNDSLINIYNTFSPFIDNMVFVFDARSWRKSITYERQYCMTEADIEDIESKGLEEEFKLKDQDYFKPYYVDENELLGYKENRKSDKEESSINYDVFNKCLEDFRLRIQSVVPVIHADGNEGDDALLQLTQKNTENKILSIIFCTDGDLKALVNDYTILYRNIRSGVAPDGEFCISKGIHKIIDNSGDSVVYNMLNTSDSNREYFNKLFTIDIGNAGGYKLRLYPDAITLPEPNTNLMLKVVCGDKKDNIFPIFRWTNGTKNYKVTENHISKAFDAIGTSYCEENVKTVFNDKKLMSLILMKLPTIIKKQVPIKLVGKHFNHNRLMNELTLENIPDYVRDNFNLIYSKCDLLNQTLNINKLSVLKLKTQVNDSAKDLLVNSFVTDSILDGVTPTSNTTNSLIDEILNS